jgi:hypothetical protein
MGGCRIAVRAMRIMRRHGMMRRGRDAPSAAGDGGSMRFELSVGEGA